MICQLFFRNVFLYPIAAFRQQGLAFAQLHPAQEQIYDTNQFRNSAHGERLAVL